MSLFAIGMSVVAFAQTNGVPEIDPTSGVSAFASFGGLLMLRARKR
jgi:hypothetical protein